MKPEEVLIRRKNNIYNALSLFLQFIIPHYTIVKQITPIKKIDAFKRTYVHKYEITIANDAEVDIYKVYIDEDHIEFHFDKCAEIKIFHNGHTLQSVKNAIAQIFNYDTV